MAVVVKSGTATPDDAADEAARQTAAVHKTAIRAAAAERPFEAEPAHFFAELERLAERGPTDGDADGADGSDG